MESQPILSVKNLSAHFPESNGGLTNGHLHALDNISFEVQPREFICFLGPSGSGKTTLLRILANLLQPTSGYVQFQQQHPKIGMVFQKDSLMPWRTVLDNIKLPLEVEGVNDTDAWNRAMEMIELVGLHGFESALPRDLSGGMAQRVGIARALVHDPDLLLLDEPFASLDAITREKMWTELSHIWEAKQKTVIMVTHSINESLFLADRVLVLTQRPGKIKMDVEVELPRPRTDDIRYSARFGIFAGRLRDAIK